MKIFVVFYSTFGHVYRLSESIAKGAREVDGAEVELLQVAETLPEEVLGKMGALEARKAFAHIPVVEPNQLRDADAIIFGTPTRFGNMSAQMKTLLDATGGIWQSGDLMGKVGSVFTSTASQHGGQETTLTSFHTVLLHHGMVVVGVPYSCELLSKTDEMCGGTPYGASTIAAPDGSRQVSETELEIARFQGRHVADIARKLTN